MINNLQFFNFQLNFTSDQSRYKILLANTRDSNDDKLESVKNLVNTIENEHQLMDPMVLQDATRTFLDIEANNEFNTNDEIMNHCNLGLGKILTSFATYFQYSC